LLDVFIKKNNAKNVLYKLQFASRRWPKRRLKKLLRCKLVKTPVKLQNKPVKPKTV
jgi:hypothetical protein